MKNKFRYVPLLILVIIISLNIGFAVFGTELLASDIGATVRIKADVRVTGVVPVGSTDDAISNAEDYNVTDALVNFCLPQGTSTVTYKIEVTNFGNTEMGILDINGLPSGLTYEIEDGVLKEPICDNNGKCTLGAVKEFNITIKYIDNTATANTCFDTDLNVIFKGFHTVTYINAPRGNDYKTKIIDGEEFVQEYSPAGGMKITYTSSGSLISGATYSVSKKKITVPADKVTEDITIRFNTLGEYINKLYTDGTKSTVTNGGYTYNRVTSLGLINDRLGGRASSVDGGNVRYYGTSANNYIYYNCKNYDNQSSSTCETWRIIGVFDGKVKIIRGSSIGTLAFGTNSNKWETAPIKMLLNPGHENESIDGSLYWNAKSGKCYNGETGLFTHTYTTTDCDFTNTGLQNDDTRNFISDETLYFTSPNLALVSISDMYYYERGNGSIYSGNPTSWTGKVSLIYPTDYYYSANLSNCTSQIYWLGTGCGNTSWMKQSSKIWTLTPGQSGATNGWYIDASSKANYNDVYEPYLILPTLYTNTNTIFIDGNGSSSNPYKIYPVAS